MKVCRRPINGRTLMSATATLVMCASLVQYSQPNTEARAVESAAFSNQLAAIASRQLMPAETRTVLNDVTWVNDQGDLASSFIPESETPGKREDGSGAFRTHCIESHLSFDDPLVKPGQPGAAHQHVFFGNPRVDAFTTPKTLRDATVTTCDGVSINKSAYWVPALNDQSGERITYVDPLFYYKTGYHVPAEAITPPPEGLRIIAGNAMSKAAQDIRVAKFRCESWQPSEPQFSAGDPLDHVSYIPNCPLDDIVEIRLVFPQCWDGVNLTAPDHQSHMAYPLEGQAPLVGTGSCPGSHPVAIPEISYNFGIRVTAETGPSSTWRFVTDSADGTTGGHSLHGDWINGWDDETMSGIVSNCLNPGLECMVGLLGNGEQLRPVILNDEETEPLPGTNQPWDWNGYERFPSLYFAAEPDGRFSRRQMRKITQFQLAILEFRMGQFVDEDGGGRWAGGDLGGLMANEVRRIKKFSDEAPPVLTYLSAEWAGAMYQDQRKLLNRRPELFLRDPRDCEGFIEYPQDINETGFSSPADFCRWDFRRKAAQKSFLRVVKTAAEGNADGIFFDGGHTVSCDEASTLSRMTLKQRGRFMDGQHRAYRRAFSYLAKQGQYPILSTTVGFAEFQGQVPWGDDCPRAEEDLPRALDGIPFARNNEFWTWNLGALASRQIHNAIEESRRGIPTIVHMPYFPEDAGCLEGCFDVQGKRVRFTKNNFLEFGMAAFLVSMGPGSYFGFSDMQSDPEGGGWFDESWDFFPKYDQIVTGAPIGDVFVSRDGMKFRRLFENGVAMVNVADGSYVLDFS